MLAKPKALLSWSSGKDSAWTLHAIRQRAELDVVGLVTTVNEIHHRVAIHGVRMELLEAQSKSAGVPLWKVPIPNPCSNEEYEAEMTKVLKKAKSVGVTVMAFGDLFLEDIRQYRVERLSGSGIEPLFPIWGIDTTVLAMQMISSGLRARITCVDPKQLAASFAGREFDKDFLNNLPSEVDPCGERGEFHTYAYDGPMFRHPISVRQGEIVERGGFIFADFLFDS
jgi:uncharacterized protein (TIGR00290 family)